MWILLFTVWALTADGDYKAEEQRAGFSNSDECSAEGNKRVNEATKKGQPATFYCFKKGEKIG